MCIVSETCYQRKEEEKKIPKQKRINLDFSFILFHFILNRCKGEREKSAELHTQFEYVRRIYSCCLLFGGKNNLLNYHKQTKEKQ